MGAGIEKYLVIYGSEALASDIQLIDQTSVTAPLDIAPPRVDLTLKREGSLLFDMDIKVLREKPRRDWEQRQKTRRRK